MTFTGRIPEMCIDFIEKFPSLISLYLNILLVSTGI